MSTAPVVRCLLLLDAVEGYESPASDLENPDVWALNEMLCTLVGWDIDVLTYQNEVLRGGAEHNLATVLAHTRGCTHLDWGMATSRYSDTTAGADLPSELAAIRGRGTRTLADQVGAAVVGSV